MRWYRLWCPQCGWKAKQLVTEEVAQRVLHEVTYCKECDAAKRTRSEFRAMEIITSTPKGKR